MSVLRNFYKNKILIISLLCLLFLGINSHISFAQILGGGQHPPGIKWRQIQTENFQLLYPSELEMEAQRMANGMTYMLQRIGRTLNKNPKPISIILQNQTTESNGFVQLAPRRSEFYAIPAQEFDYQDWLNSLAIHELRHVVQFDKISGNLKAPLFESLAFSFFGTALPAWFFEGDAVVTETALTQAGRGRQPSWEMTFRTNLLNGRRFSYAKNYFGSFKDRTPGYYQLGYFMMAKLRRDHGTYILDTLLRDITQHPLRLFNLSHAAKKHTGMNTQEWHAATLKEIHELWNKQRYASENKLYPGINQRKDTIPHDYLLPHRINAREILVLKRSKLHTPALVLLNNEGKEKLLLHIGIQQEPHLSYAAGKVVWDEFREDVRYDKRSYNVICLYDFKKKTYRQLTHRTRLFSPSLSPDGQKIAAIEVDFANRMNLVELDANSGKLLNRFQNQDLSNLQTPKYDASGQKIVYIRVNQSGKSIEEIDLLSGKSNTRLTAQPQLLSRPSYQGEDILFKAHYNGIDNIYRLKPNGAISQVSFATYGAFYPYYSEADQAILFSNYQLNGYDIAEIPLKELNEQPLKDIKSHFVNYAAPIAAQEGGAIDFNQIPNKKFSSSRYRPFAHSFNFHSILPVLERDTYTDDRNIGIEAVSGDLFNTLDFSAGYVYATGLQRSAYRASLSYKALFPLFNLNFLDEPARYMNEEISANWREQTSELKMYVPFRFNFLNQFGRTGLELATSYTKRYQLNFDYKLANTDILRTLKFPMHYNFYFEQNSMTSSRDLAPRWGHNYRLGYRHFPFDSKYQGSISSLQTLFFAPGLLRNHSFSASINFQRSSGNYSIQNDIPTVSGYNQLKNTAKVENTVLLDYRFPFAYPDWEIGPLAYIKRLRAGFFADFENLNLDKGIMPRTYGFELSADMNLLRFYLPNFRPGGKIIFSTENNNKSPIFEFGLTYSY